MANIGFIGVGNMGGLMAINLIKAGHAVKIFDLIPKNIKAVADHGAVAAVDVNDAAKNMDVVITMLPAGKHVKSVYMDNILTIVDKNTLLIDCSTIDVETSRAVHKAAADKGLLMVDAPVSGGVGGAAAATLTFMIGGNDQAFDKASIYLKVMGKNLVHCGGYGNGQAAKICNNMMLGIQMISVAEAFVLAEKLGLDHQKLFDVASTASGQCWSLTTYCPVPGPVPTSPANNDYAPGFAVDMMLKDLKLAKEASISTDAATILGQNAADIYQKYSDAGAGNMDFSGIINKIRG